MSWKTTDCWPFLSSGWASCTTQTRQYSVLVRADRLQAGGLVITSQLTNAITGLKVEVNEPSPEPARVD